ncbi:hypothetical protein HPB47_016043 [Ixodes persulcatus]|uniref:Uncharacterized protein n=1 Tax=Ixodes persulcatus TaxID=34615 RepID=A0AC60QRW6_IXOPE|nr:hypothetical protein HPB47_016043 [Ixodes persulcatus]
MKSALDKRPELCLEPKLRPVAKLALVRGIAGKASFEDKKSPKWQPKELRRKDYVTSLGSKLQHNAR